MRDSKDASKEIDIIMTVTKIRQKYLIKFSIVLKNSENVKKSTLA